MASGIVIASLITGNAVLTSLNLYLNSIGNEGAIAIANALKSGRSVLTSLDVGFNNLEEEAALGIVRAVRPRDQMASLGLARCSIGPTGAAEIVEYVKGSAVLTTLKCAFCARICELHLKTCTHTFSLLARICQYH